MITLGDQANEVNLHVETPAQVVLCEYIALYADAYNFLFVHIVTVDGVSALGRPLHALSCCRA